MNVSAHPPAADLPAVQRSVPVTHLHIYTVLRSLIAEGSFTPRGDQPLRVLDIGCGDGLLMDSIVRLAAAEPDLFPVEVHGFDIGEQGYRDNGQQAQAIRMLAAQHPGTNWASRVRLVAADQPWGYPPGYFDVAVSNQVIEHVHDLEGMLDQIEAAVRTDGASIHLFPLAECIQEAHCLVPFAHWIGNFDHRAGWIALMSRLGVGRYRRDRVVLGHGTPAEHGRKTAAYIQCWTHYRSFAEIVRHCRGRGLALSYHFTKNFFAAKLRRIAGLRPPAHYRRHSVPGLEWLSFKILRRLSSATVVIRPVAYDIGTRIAAEKAAQVAAAKPASVSLAA